MAKARQGPPAEMAWLRSLHDPELALGWTLPEWERVVRIARRLRLLARLAEALSDSDMLTMVPNEARRHLVSEQRLSRWRTSSVLWTAERVAAALIDAPYPHVLLKGAAYLAQRLPIASGRLPADLDMLVPREFIADALDRLSHAGWQSKALDEHDRRYYYEWSHEVPPMSHPLYLAELDLHHNILPPVARTRVDAGLLLRQLAPTSFMTWKALSPEDQVLHSAAHLFFDSDLTDRIRDVVDLDGLLRYFGSDVSFYPRLAGRAVELGLEEPLALACHFCVRWMATPLPTDVVAVIEPMGPGKMKRAWLIPTLERALLPSEPDDVKPYRQRAALVLLSARYHLWRMPIRLLVPHALHKLRRANGVAAPVQA